MSARVVGLGHVGLYVQDLERMKAFYRDFMGMTLTKCSDTAAFFSSDPARSDHEVALALGRPSADDPHLINQISLRVETLDGLRDFHRRMKSEGYKIDRIVTHASAIGCYFRDPEDNRTEVFWLTGLPSWVNIGVPIDIERPDEEIMADVRYIWEQVRHVGVGEKPDAETAAVIRELVANGTPVRVTS
jgi:catechol 2,3-dioxygenase-like lactoylglutathione lyase family enzyme